MNDGEFIGAYFSLSVFHKAWLASVCNLIHDEHTSTHGMIKLSNISLEEWIAIVRP